ncbi:MAG: hypothetical protein ACK4ZJ_15940, partial [Allorhizobium sp.]
MRRPRRERASDVFPADRLASMLPPFSGEESELIEPWLCSFEDLRASWQWGDLVSATHLRMSLRNEAQRWLMAQDEGTRRNYYLLVEA